VGGLVIEVHAWCEGFLHVAVGPVSADATDPPSRCNALKTNRAPA